MTDAGKNYFAVYIILFSLPGAVIGYLFLHPVSMYIHSSMCEPYVSPLKIFRDTFSVEHLPMALFFSALGGLAGAVQGLYVGRILVANIELKKLAIVDYLTGLYTRRFIFEALDRELKRASRTGEPLAVAMIDLDHFKKYNDTHGHIVGDELLRRFGALIRTSIRQSDLSGRYGGEEFIIVFQNMTSAQAYIMIERLRISVSHKDFFKVSNTQDSLVTFSAGISEFPGDSQEASNLVNMADQALFDAKHLGRNQTRLANNPDFSQKNAPRNSDAPELLGLNN